MKFKDYKKAAHKFLIEKEPYDMKDFLWTLFYNWIFVREFHIFFFSDEHYKMHIFLEKIN